MSNELATRANGKLALKGELAELLGDQFGLSDLTSGVNIGFPVLSIKGKVFHIKEGGEAELVTQPDDDDAPAPALEVVLVKANPHVSKVYYEDGYVEGADAKPTCYSNDGTKPADDSEDKQCTTCAACPKNQWGSRITEAGKKGKACSDARRVAVAPAGDLERVMLLRIPAASLKPLMQYGQALTKKGIPYCAVVTKLAFDYTVAHPLLTFKPVRPITVDEAMIVKEMIASEVTEAILHGGNAEQIAAEVSAADEEFENATAGAGAAAAILAGSGAEDNAKPEVEAAAEAPSKPTRKPRTSSAKAATAAAEVKQEATPPVETGTTSSEMDDELTKLLGDFDN